MAHYDDAFSVTEGRCFRFVHSGVGNAQHCPDPIVARGTFTDSAGRKWTVDAWKGTVGSSTASTAGTSADPTDPMRAGPGISRIGNGCRRNSRRTGSWLDWGGERSSLVCF